jgi:hypothetical protein
VVSLRYGAFPAWLGWLSAVVAGAQAFLCLSTAFESGPFASDSLLSFVLYPFFLIWLVPATVIMVRRVGRPRMTMSDPLPGRVEVGSQPTTS